MKLSTTMTFMGGAVTAPIPAHAKEDSRMKKSKSMVRKDIFGDHKPKSLATHNKKGFAKGPRITSAPQPMGAGTRATKTEIWEEPGKLDMHRL